MSEQAKVALRYQFVLEKLSGASGDFARTSNSWANQMRVLKLQIESIKAAIGQGLINLFTPVIKMLNTLLEKLRSVAGAFKSFTEAFSGKTSTGKAEADNKKYADSSDNLAGSIENVSDAAQEAEKSLEGYLNPLDEVNKYETGKDDDLLPDLENIDFGNLDNLNVDVTVTPQIDDSELSDKFTKFAKKVKNILKKIFSPLKKAWANEGQFVIDSWKYGLDEVWKLIKDIGHDFLEVWKQPKTVAMLEDIFHIVGDIGLVAGNLAEKFREAWNANNTGLHILENIRDIFSVIIHNIREAADYTVEWSKKLDFSPLLEGIERLTASLVPFFDFMSGTLADFYTQFLLPLASWTLSEEGIPRLLNILAEFMERVDWEGLRNALRNLYSALEPYAEAIGTGLLDFIDRLKEYGIEFLNSLPDSINKIADFLRGDGFRDFADSLVPVVEALGGALEDFYNKALLPLGEWVLNEAIPELLGVLTGFNEKVNWEELRNNLSEFWEHLEPFAETVGEGLILFIERVSDALADFLNSREFKDFLVMVENWMDSVSPEDVADALENVAKSLIALKLALT